MKQILSLLVLTITALQLFAQTDSVKTKGLIDKNKLSKEKPFAVKVKDASGNTYKAIRIGTQVWLNSDLKTTKFKDGTEINLMEQSISWVNTTHSAYSWMDNNPGTGTVLYNWYAANSGKLCPTGWHVPTNDEWDILINYLGYNTANDKLKEKGTVHWKAPNEGANNESGFTALPKGQRNWSGNFSSDNAIAYFWTSSEEFSKGIVRRLFYNQHTVGKVTEDKRNGYGVRCIKD